MKPPETKEEYVDFYFPKGDPRRGHALVIMAISFLEGKEKGRGK